MISSPAFSVEEHTTLGKSFKITGPGDLVMHVDYDDVNHHEVDRLAYHLVDLLNEISVGEWETAMMIAQVEQQLEWDREEAEEEERRRHFG